MDLRAIGLQEVAATSESSGELIEPRGLLSLRGRCLRLQNDVSE